MWGVLFLFVTLLYLLIPKDTVEERQDREDFIDELLFLDDDEDDDFLLEEIMLLWDEEDEEKYE